MSTLIEEDLNGETRATIHVMGQRETEIQDEK